MAKKDQVWLAVFCDGKLIDTVPGSKGSAVRKKYRQIIGIEIVEATAEDLIKRKAKTLLPRRTLRRFGIDSGDNFKKQRSAAVEMYKGFIEPFPI
jgi:hypothetical protein